MLSMYSKCIEKIAGVKWVHFAVYDVGALLTILEHKARFAQYVPIYRKILIKNVVRVLRMTKKDYVKCEKRRK